MDRWLNLKRNADNDDEDTSLKRDGILSSSKKKLRLYNKDYLSFGFTCTSKADEQLPQCVLCYEVLSNEAMKPSKLQRHLISKHEEHSKKSIDFFRIKEQHLLSSKTMVKKTATGCNNESLVRASFEISQLIAKTGKPHTIGEELIMPAAKIMVSAVIGEKAAKDLSLIPVSNDTVKKRIHAMSCNIKEKLLERVRSSPYYALQLDESTDITKKAVLLCFVRYLCNKDIAEDILLIANVIHTTADEMFNILNEFMTHHNVDWKKCIGISTDGARAMSGHISGLRTRIQEFSPSATWNHCCIHREALVSSKMSENLKQTLNESVSIVNFIKSKPLNSRLFEQLCENMDSDHSQLLLHCEIRWLSRGKFLSRFWELRDEIRLFLTERKFHLSDCLNSFSWLLKLAYLSDIFCHLNMVNLSLQGVHVTVFQVEDKIEAFVKKLELWHHRLISKRDYNFEAFPNLKDFLHSNEEKISEEDTMLITEHLLNLKQTFREYFPVPDRKNNWVRDPFAVDVLEQDGLTSVEEQLIEISTDGALKLLYKNKSLPNFWGHLQENFPELSTKALKVLMPFQTTYLCEKAFSALVYLKNKYRNRMDSVEPDLRLQISNITPDITALIKEMQHHPSH